MPNEQAIFSPEELQNPFDAIFAVGYRVNSYEANTKSSGGYKTRPSARILIN